MSELLALESKGPKGWAIALRAPSLVASGARSGLQPSADHQLSRGNRE